MSDDTNTTPEPYQTLEHRAAIRYHNESVTASMQCDHAIKRAQEARAKRVWQALGQLNTDMKNIRLGHIVKRRAR